MCLGKGNWIVDMPKWNQQKYFNNWEYTSPQTLKLECHVAEEILQYNKNLHLAKVQMAAKVINALDPCSPREPNYNNAKEESGNNRNKKYFYGTPVSYRLYKWI